MRTECPATSVADAGDMTGCGQRVAARGPYRSDITNPARSDSCIAPLAEVEIPPAVAALPKADLHVHAESGARLEQVIAQQTGCPGTDWRAKARELMRDLPPGMTRMETWVAGLPYSRSRVDEVDQSPGYLEARIRRVLVEAAADGALLVVVGAELLLVIAVHADPVPIPVRIRQTIAQGLDRLAPGGGRFPW